MRRQKNKTGPENLQSAERRMQALQLRKEGLTLAEIGQKLGVSAVQIHKYIKSELEAIRADTHEMAMEERDIALLRLEELHGVLWSKIFPNGGQESPLDESQLKAVDKILKIMERRAKLLGLDAPQKLEPVRPAPEPITPEKLKEIQLLVYGSCDKD